MLISQKVAWFFFLPEAVSFLLYTVNPLYTDIRYNDKTRYNDSLDGVNLLLKEKRIIKEIKQYCI